MKNLRLFLIVFILLSGNYGLQAQKASTNVSSPDDFFSSRDEKFLYHGKEINGKKDGNWLVYYAHDSSLHKVENYQMGLKHGIFLQFSTRSTLISEEYFKNDLPEGLQRTYTNAGIVETVNFYRHGKLEGVQKKFYENRRDKLSELSNYKNGLKEGVSKWFDMEGNLIAEYNYHNGLLEGAQKSFYPNGKLRSIDHFVTNQYEGESIEYYDDGKVKLSGQYEHGEKQGKWQKFDPSGKLENTEIYKNGQLRK
ncbi:MAG: toxin-antitoxin system YwqK family antitoxin [Lentimicrobium sp.]|jgi:antitoxin component YwqK of YwqJK toxin-antitoxin module|nr:toxin-antitoxin system YwqK family antitoxin [Lentimicrobium sp.]MDD2527853.1 toxin-antitoxin system YwqK family antitoxin [Lentimicrobiaceae bacterium]MDD4596951.1 toxin-antitoxin system YwqK family antitoxin [Lentimicrobiaceae bacterium]MDY0024367.1 toxin-antitoxin system YwqK family antitoxin [Lentimicrobium sp.]